MSWIFNGAGSFEKLPVQEDGPRTCHSERSEESQNECAEAKHIKIQDFSCLTTFHCNSIFALLLSFPKSLNFLLSPQTLPVSRLSTVVASSLQTRRPMDGYEPVFRSLVKTASSCLFFVHVPMSVTLGDFLHSRIFLYIILSSTDNLIILCL